MSGVPLVERQHSQVAECRGDTALKTRLSKEHQALLIARLRPRVVAMRACDDSQVVERPSNANLVAQRAAQRQTLFEQRARPRGVALIECDDSQVVERL